MNDYLPHFYRDSKTVASVIAPEAEELASLSAVTSDVLDQFFVPSATWGLARWEKIFGLPTDLSKTYEQRRAIIMSRIRGTGAVTPALIAIVASAFANGEVAVRENDPFTPYTIEVKFVGTRGVPNDLPALKEAIREILPAHLEVAYAFTYLIWDELDLNALAWSDLDDALFTWDTLERAHFEDFVSSSIGLTQSEL